MKDAENKGLREDLKDLTIEKLKKEGLGFILLVCLFVYMINDAKIREEKYQTMITNLTTVVSTDMKEIKSDISEIKINVRGAVRQ